MSTQTPHGSEPMYETIVERNVMIPLRDGLALATDIYFPARNGKRIAEPMPTLLTRTPYDKRNMGDEGKYFAEHGYVCIAQDVRGRYESPGEFYAFAHEGPDGYDTVEWIAAQEWCDGQVGTKGGSYCGAVQSALGSLNPPHLAAMIPTFGPASYFHSSMRHNGALEMRFYCYAFTMAATSREAQADPLIKAALDDAAANLWDWVGHFPIRRGCSPLALVPSYEQWCIDISTRARYDDYWKQPGYGPMPWYDQHADVPTLYVGGWFDTYTRNTLENFVEMSKRQKTAVHALVGPWTHNMNTPQNSGDASFAPDGGHHDFRAVQRRWFDHWLKGIDTGLDLENRVRYFLMGGGTGEPEKPGVISHGGVWKSATDWPVPGAEPTPFYMHADGSLRAEAPEGEPDPTRYQFDPDNPVPTIGGQLSALPIPAGGFDQRNGPRFPTAKGNLPLSAQPDVLVFQTEPLERDLEVVGPVRVRLWVSTDGLDTDFTAKLLDIYPPTQNFPAGCAMNLTDSILRLRFRNGLEREELATPGEVYEMAFDMYPTANLFARGHRIRVDVSSSNYPRFDANPNTGGPLGIERRRRAAENALYHSRACPSQIILQVASR